MRESDPLPQILHDLLAGQTLATLATTGVHSPYASLIAFSVSDDLHRLHFVTSRSTRKSVNLEAVEQVALLVDDRKNQPEDFAEAAAVTIRGRAQRLQGDQRQQAAKRYLIKFPYLEEFVSSPNCDLYEVRVQQFLLVTRFQHVTEFWLD